MASEIVTDESLMQMTTLHLRTLLEQKLITAEQHRGLRSRRRRLQNRKYARKCAKKKQTEVARLTEKTEEETSEIKSLRDQLQRVNMSIDKIERQFTMVSDVRLAAERGAPFQPLRMVTRDGAEAGFAYLASQGNVTDNTLLLSKSEIALSEISRDDLHPLSGTCQRPPMKIDKWDGERSVGYGRCAMSGIPLMSSGRQVDEAWHPVSKRYGHFPSTPLVSPAGGGMHSYRNGTLED